ncbi:hypothetical protein GUJ93_ZPchr0002g24241 [Zizania palustris]|uniref:Uncharacterized protein n=1 Tax=Zizania palustris TaxID=103762 RepID=A0A8J5V421_ZIZPA|nr:hypothetical protein GUJ93_ZPchr0002g24241 [Zizania palustris]KAG8058143.1 hypothetical protein GUJ93_ZPchr0002g24241 [Zizania palustris]
MSCNHPDLSLVEQLLLRIASLCRRDPLKKFRRDCFGALQQVQLQFTVLSSCCSMIFHGCSINWRNNKKDPDCHKQT